MSTLPPQNDMPRITQDELNIGIETHINFLAGRRDGKRLIMTFKDLSGLNFHNRDLSEADFTGSDLSNADLAFGTFRGANFFSCNFANADLSYADMSRCDMRGTYLSGADMEQTNFTNADMRSGSVMEQDEKKGLKTRQRTTHAGDNTILSGARMINANLSGLRGAHADFNDSDLTGAIFKSASVKDANFTNANLSHATFAGADISHSDMTRAIINNTNLNASEKQGVTQSEFVKRTQRTVTEDLKNTLTQRIENHTIWVESAGRGGKRLDLSDYDLRDIPEIRFYALTAIKAQNTCFINLDLNGAEMQSCAFDHSDFRDCNLNKADLRGSSLKNALLTRADLREANFGALVFKTKRAPIPTNLSGADLRLCNMVGCDLNHAVLMGVDFTDADLTNANLEGADLSGAILKNATLKNANLTDAIIDLSMI